jgi:hypothetical protein
MLAKPRSNLGGVEVAQELLECFQGGVLQFDLTQLGLDALPEKHALEVVAPGFNFIGPFVNKSFRNEQIEQD